MTEVINCPSCGASNQFPEGKNSMFCAFCGNSINKTIVSSSLITKNLTTAKIKKESSLAYENRDVNSIQEIVDLYPDSELGKVKYLFLNNNNITSIKSISKFRAVTYNLSKNKIANISDDDISELNNLKFRVLESNLGINFINNPFVSLEWLRKFDYKRILSTAVVSASHLLGDNRRKDFDNVEINLSFSTIKDYNLDFFKDDNIRVITNDETTKITFYHPENNLSPKNFSKHIESLEKQTSGSCFIATATMGSYDNPMVMELRYFRDNWILQKKWGNSFVRWYYVNGAIVAKFIEKSFVLKKLSYILIVKPLVFLSRFLKNHSI